MPPEIAEAPDARPDPMVYHTYAKGFLTSLHHKPSGLSRLLWDNGTFWLWEDGVYRSLTKRVLTSMVLRWMIEKGIGSYHPMAVAVRECLAAMTYCRWLKLPGWVPPVPKKAGTDWLAFRNKMVEPRRLALGEKYCTQHLTPRWFSNVQLPYAFDPKAESPRWEACVVDRLVYEENVLFLQEFFGYLQVVNTSHHAAMVLIGAAGSGKSSLAEMAILMLGKDNCTTLPLEQFGTNKWALAQTAGKHLNYSDEVGKLTPTNIQMVKWWISGAGMMVERKGVDPFPLTPTARLILTMNEWEDLPDSSGGMWRRLHVLRLRDVIPPDRLQLDHTKEIHKAEAPGIFNWANRGLARLLAQGHFTEPRGSAAEKLVATRRARSAALFIEQRLQFSPGNFISNADLVSKYALFCSLEGLGEPRSLLELKKGIHAVWSDVETQGRPKRDGESVVRGVTGVSWNESTP